MSQTKFLKASGPSMKPRSMGLGRLLVRLLVLSVVVCVLLIGVAWAFGALWFDFPVAVLRQPLAAAFGLSAVAALVFVRPHWRNCARGRVGAYDPTFQYARLAAPGSRNALRRN